VQRILKLLCFDQGGIQKCHPIATGSIPSANLLNKAASQLYLTLTGGDCPRKYDNLGRFGIGGTLQLFDTVARDVLYET